MGRIVERSQELLDGPGGWGRFGFYTSGQLFLEEYYTLAVIGKAGIGTPHMDGNTRLCTATAAAALKASFGTDGQPGSYSDVDHCDALALWGHNVRRDPDRAVDADARPPSRDRTRRRCSPSTPAPTPVGREADVHLAVRNGTNVALMNGVIRELLAHGWYRRGLRRGRTRSGSSDLQATVEPYTPERVAEICDVPDGPGRRGRRAGRHLRPAGVSTVLQGFYQSNQATAAACQVNNIHLLRGMIGRPGAGVFQMNGQPTAQNNRETGADGDLPGMRNWDNPRPRRSSSRSCGTSTRR